MSELPDTRAGVVRRGIHRSGAWGILANQFPLAVLVCLVLLPITVAGAYQWGALGNPPWDMGVFGPAGRSLLLGQLSEVYADPIVQAGPFELVPYGLAQLIGIQGVVQWSLFSGVVGWLVTLALLTVLLLPRNPPKSRLTGYIALAIGGLACLGGFVPEAVTTGHPAQVIIPLLWVIAACAARVGQPLACGVLIGLSAGWEVWGVLGAPIILLAAHPRILRTGIATAGTAFVLYLPFVVSGHFGMFGMTWRIGATSLPHFLAPDLATFPWTLRLAQAGLAVALGCAVAVLTRSSDYGIWLVPLTILLVRLVPDPLLFGYYWVAPATVALLLAGALLMSREWVAGSITVALILVVCIPPARTVPVAVAMLAAVGAATAAVAVRARAPREARDRLT